MTVKGTYDGRQDSWALVAALKVIDRKESHSEAAEWYHERGEPLPSNCLVEGNPPLPEAQTTGLPAQGPGMQQDWVQNGRPPNNMAEWDAHYWSRSAAHPVFLITERLAIELTNPPILSRDELRNVFHPQRMPVTRTFESINDAEFETLTSLLR